MPENEASLTNGAAPAVPELATPNYREQKAKELAKEIKEDFQILRDSQAQEVWKPLKDEDDDNLELCRVFQSEQDATEHITESGQRKRQNLSNVGAALLSEVPKAYREAAILQKNLDHPERKWYLVDEEPNTSDKPVLPSFEQLLLTIQSPDVPKKTRLVYIKEALKFLHELQINPPVQAVPYKIGERTNLSVNQEEVNVPFNSSFLPSRPQAIATMLEGALKHITPLPENLRTIIIQRQNIFNLVDNNWRVNATQSKSFVAVSTNKVEALAIQSGDISMEDIQKVVDEIEQRQGAVEHCKRLYRQGAVAKALEEDKQRRENTLAILKSIGVEV